MTEWEGTREQQQRLHDLELRVLYKKASRAEVAEFTALKDARRRHEDERVDEMLGVLRARLCGRPRPEEDSPDTPVPAA